MEKDRKKYAYNYLIKQGYSPVVAAGIVGNLIAESGLKTDILGTADDKGSNGIAQWHSGRLTGLKKFAKSTNRKWDDLDAQLDYITYELNNDYKFAKNKLKYAKTPEEASEAFMQHYEKPAKWAIAQSRGERAKNARDLFGGELDPEYVNKYQGTIIDRENEQDEAKVQPTKNYLPDLITMQGKESNEVVDLSFAEKAEEAKEQIQQYQEVEDKINQMPTTQAPIQQQVEQQSPSYQYLFNQELFNIQ